MCYNYWYLEIISVRLVIEKKLTHGPIPELNASFVVLLRMTLDAYLPNEAKQSAGCVAHPDKKKEKLAD